MSWTYSMDEMLKRLWAEKFTGSEIAAKMNTALRGNLSRSSVLARARRIGLGRREPALISIVPKSKASAPVPKVNEFKQKGRVELLELKNNECRFPHNDGLYCAATVCGTGMSYCEKHFQLCYKKWAKK